ncbi:MAG: DNA-methyltransferase [Candidatus Heimdallarchaeaceae archaeon]
MIKIYCGDAFKLIKNIKDKSVDLIFTDPPYKKGTTVKMKELTRMQMKAMANEFARVLKRTGNLALFCGLYDKWDWYQYLCDVGLKYKIELLWIYPNPSTFRFQKRQFIPSHDTILWFAKSDDYYFSDEGYIELSWFKYNAFVGFLRGKEYIPNEKLNVTPKPLQIALTIVKRLCPPNGIVLDPFAGLGTFGIACKLLGRNYIGFEINKELYNLALNRLKKYPKHTLKSFFEGDFYDF